MIKTPFPKIRSKANKIGGVRQVPMKPIKAPKIKQSRVISGKMRRPRTGKMNVGY
jgi:hypothetical protein